MDTSHQPRLVLLLMLGCLAFALSGLAEEPVRPPQPAPAVTAAQLEAVRQMMPEVVASMRDWTLGRDYVWRRIESKVKRVLASGNEVPLGLLRYLARPIVNDAIEERLLGTPASAQGFPPDLVRSGAHLEGLLADPKTRTEAEQFLLERGLSREEYIQELAVRTAITDWVRQRFVVPQEVSEEEVSDRYRECHARLALPATIRLQRIVVPQAQAGQDEATATGLLVRIREAIAAGTPFAEAAELGAEGAGVASYDETRTTLQALPEEVREVVADLARGEVSEVIEVSGTLALVRWTEPLPAREVPLAEAAAALRVNLQEEKGRVAFKAFLQERWEAEKVVIYPPLENPTKAWPASTPRKADGAK